MKYTVTKKPLTANTIWDAAKGEVLCKFKDGVVETDDDALASRLEALGHTVKQNEADADSDGSNDPDEKPVDNNGDGTDTDSDSNGEADADSDGSNDPDEKPVEPKPKARRSRTTKK